eukprot:m.342618 g.342618  ORF g.342618 m.342618 type:complete len:187 (-) comp21634_c0_seq1:289-849(-)
MDVQVLESMLRLGCFCCYVGHGTIALFRLEWNGWIKFMRIAGFSDKESYIVMPAIGLLDILLALVTFFDVVPMASCWMVVWAFATALMRLLAGRSILGLLGFVERAANWMCPFALLYIHLHNGLAKEKSVVGKMADSVYNVHNEETALICMNGMFAFLAVFCVLLHIRNLITWAVSGGTDTGKKAK